MSPQMSKRHWRHCHGAALLGLRHRAYPHTVVADADHPLDGDRAGVEIDVAPTQRQGLAAPTPLLGGQPEIG